MTEHEHQERRGLKRQIEVGDVCLDLLQGSLVQVVDVTADSVEEHRMESDFDLAEYGAHPLLGVDELDKVYRAVYLKSQLKSLPEQSYEFPDSRLVRIPVENPRDDLYPPQQRIKMDLFDRVAEYLVENLTEEDADMFAGVISDSLTPLEREFWSDSYDIAVEFTAEEAGQDGD